MSIRTFLFLLLMAVPAARAGIAVITTDYATFGGVTTLADQSPWQAGIDAATISSDAVGRFHDGLFYVVNRAAASIQVLDPATGMGQLREFSLGVGRNPQDIAFGPDGAAYVSCYDEALLLKIDTVSGLLLDSWSTARFADADGLPETGWMYLHGDRLLITCQRLDRNDWWQAVGAGWLLVFDLTTQQWLDVDPLTPETDAIVLSGANPNTRPVPTADTSRILVGTAGAYGAQDGGIEEVDCTTLSTAGYLVTESDLGADLLDVEFCDTHVWALLSTPTWQTLMVRFPVTGEPLVEVLETAAGYDHSDLAFDGGNQILLADRAFGREGVRVFSSLTGLELTAAPVATGRPPFMIAVDADVDTANVPSAGLVMQPPWPNPANPLVNFQFSGRPDRDYPLEIMDLRGRLVFSASIRTDATGGGHFSFNGRGFNGRALPSGVYRATVGGAGGAGRGFVLVH